MLYFIQSWKKYIALKKCKFLYNLKNDKDSPCPWERMEQWGNNKQKAIEQYKIKEKWPYRIEYLGRIVLKLKPNGM